MLMKTSIIQQIESSVNSLEPQWQIQEMQGNQTENLLIRGLRIMNDGIDQGSGKAMIVEF